MTAKALKAYFKARASIGGKARAQKLSKARRSAIAKKAANARWDAYRKAQS